MRNSLRTASPPSRSCGAPGSAEERSMPCRGRAPPRRCAAALTLLMKAGPLDLAITPDRSSIEISSWNQPSLALSSGASVLLRMGADAGEFAGDIVESVASLRRNRGESAANHDARDGLTPDPRRRTECSTPSLRARETKSRNVAQTSVLSHAAGARGASGRRQSQQTLGRAIGGRAIGGRATRGRATRGRATRDRATRGRATRGRAKLA
jgi:hypothetical protein